MSGRVYSQRKQEYFARLTGLFRDYSRVFVVGADNVGSFQMQQVRIALRGDGPASGQVIFGKNTMMRKVLTNFLNEDGNADHPMGQLMDFLQGNVGLVFTNSSDLVGVKKTIVENVVPAPARAGALAPVSVIVPAGNTGMDPGQTSFFQALNIATKITRGLVEIINDVALVTAGERVTPGQAALLKRLDIMPFSYGLSIVQVYNEGSLFDPKVLDLTNEMLEQKFMQHVSGFSAICMELGYPTTASLPHMISTNFQKMAAIALELEYEMPALKALNIQ
jgi:large subunit ribosomal protein LP0